MYQKGQRGRLERLVWATRYTLAGLRQAVLHERAFQEETLVLVLVAVPAALWFGQNGVERALLIGSWVLVMIVELLNTSVETAIDRIGAEHHELSGRAKDLGSAAVGLALALALLVWGLILFT